MIHLTCLLALICATQDGEIKGEFNDEMCGVDATT